MTIERRDCKNKKVGDLFPGECFEYEGDLFLRTDAYSTDNSIVFGVNLIDGKDTSFDRWKVVKVLEAKVVITQH